MNSETYNLIYQGLVLSAIVLNLITSLAIHFRFKSICESSVFKKMTSLSSFLQQPQPPHLDQNSS